LHLRMLFTVYLKTDLGFFLWRRTLNSMAGLSWSLKATLRDESFCFFWGKKSWWVHHDRRVEVHREVSKVGPKQSLRLYLIFSFPLLFAVFAGLFLPLLGKDLFIGLSILLLGGGLVLYVKLRNFDRRSPIKYGYRHLKTAHKVGYALGWSLLFVGTYICISKSR
jgi:hypothetical protein